VLAESLVGFCEQLAQSIEPLALELSNVLNASSNEAPLPAELWLDPART